MRAPTLLLIVVMFAGCSKTPESVLLTPTAPASPTPTTSSLFVSSVALDRRALNGGESTDATLFLSAPATTATTVALSSDAAAASVPASVTVAPGSNQASFSITTRPVDADVVATILASVEGRSAGDRLAVWTVEPNSFWYDIDGSAGFPGGAAAHITAANTVRGVCDKSDVYIQVTDPAGTWNGRFHLPNGVPIQPGTWGFSSLDSSRPWLQMSGAGRACFSGGEFTIVAADLEPSGNVRSFFATFKVACSGTSTILRGEVRMRNAPRAPGGATPSVCLR